MSDFITDFITFDKGGFDYQTTPSVPNYNGNTSEEFGDVLADQFDSSGDQAQGLFEDVENLDMLRATTEAPDDRYENNFARYGDVPFQNQVQRLVNDGTINNNSFVISDTGHDIPIMATLTGQLDMDGTLALPDFDPTEAGNGTRVASQAETWGNEISSNVNNNLLDGSVSSFFLGIEGHRKQSVDVSNFPSASELQSQGVDNVAYLVEGSPNNEYSDTGNAEMDNYLQSLRDGGIEVNIEGVDPR